MAGGATKKDDAQQTSRELMTRLAALRVASGFSQRQFAERMGVTQSMVSDLESGRTKDLLVSTLIRYVGALGDRRLRFVLDTVTSVDLLACGAPAGAGQRSEDDSK